LIVTLTARAKNNRFWLLSALRAHTKTPYKTDLYRQMLRALIVYIGPLILRYVILIAATAAARPSASERVFIQDVPFPGNPDSQLFT
jgi:hypothetical protein